MNRSTVFFALALFAAPSPCLAWGAEGHRIVAAIAADELTPAARQEVEELLGGDASVAMVQASTWADEIRPKRPDTAPWHFVDIPIQSNGYDPGRDCPADDCVVGQIDRDARIVADRQLAAPIRAEALRFLIHFVGDLHQPLHAADNDDRGGNRLRVVLRQHRTNMHAVWDVDVVRALGRGPEEISVRLEKEITPARELRVVGLACCGTGRMNPFRSRAAKCTDIFWVRAEPVPRSCCRPTTPAMSAGSRHSNSKRQLFDWRRC